MERIVLVTGATRGIGLKVAQAFASEGDRVVINGINEAEVEGAKKEMKKAGLDAAGYYLFDVTNEVSVNENVKAIGEKFGRIDVLVNNAGGLGGRSPLDNMDTEFYRKVMALNLDSMFFVTRAAIPYLKKAANFGCVVNYTSIAAWNAGGIGAGVYAASKAGVTTLTRAFAKEFAKDDIRVNAVSPGTIDTDFHQEIKKSNIELFNTWKDSILLKRLGEAEEVAKVVKFLASDDSSFITGEVIQVNGGQAFV